MLRCNASLRRARLQIHVLQLLPSWSMLRAPGGVKGFSSISLAQRTESQCRPGGHPRLVVALERSFARSLEECSTARTELLEFSLVFDGFCQLRHSGRGPESRQHVGGPRVNQVSEAALLAASESSHHTGAALAALRPVLRRPGRTSSCSASSRSETSRWSHQQLDAGSPSQLAGSEL